MLPCAIMPAPSSMIPFLLKLADDRYWLSIADSDVHGVGPGQLPQKRGLDVTVSEPDVSPLAVQGPKAEDVIASIFGDWVSGPEVFLVP